jgi:hypothetical protein
MNTRSAREHTCSHLHSFCATGVSSGLATRVTSNRVWRGRLGESITWSWTCFWFNFCTVVRITIWSATVQIITKIYISPYRKMAPLPFVEHINPLDPPLSCPFRGTHGLMSQIGHENSLLSVSCHPTSKNGDLERAVWKTLHMAQHPVCLKLSEKCPLPNLPLWYVWWPQISSTKEWHRNAVRKPIGMQHLCHVYI